MAPLSAGNGEVEGCQNLQKHRALLEGKMRQLMSSMVFPEALAIAFTSPWNSGQGQLVTLWSYVPWCLGVLHPGVGLSDGRGEVWPQGRGLESVIPREVG